MNITIQQLMRHLHAEPPEQPSVEGYLTRAKAVALQEVNRPYDNLSDNEKTVFDQIVLGMATSFYLNRDDSAKNVSKSFSSLNSLIDILRKPPLGD